MRQAVRRLGGQAVRTALALLTAYPPNHLSAQDSQFSVRGLGVPGRWESVRARTTGGAFGPFDPRSSVADVSLADALQLTATAVEATTYRRAEIGGGRRAPRRARPPLPSAPRAPPPRLRLGGAVA